MNKSIKQKIIYFMLLSSLSIFIYAGCVKTAEGYVRFSLKYKPKGQTDHIKRTRVTSKTDLHTVVLKRDGRYNGGCRTHVGRQKARKRACDNTMWALMRHFVNNQKAAQDYIRDNLVFLRGKYPDLIGAEWIAIEHFILCAQPVGRGGFKNRVRRESDISRYFKGKRFKI